MLIIQLNETQSFFSKKNIKKNKNCIFTPKDFFAILVTDLFTSNNSAEAFLVIAS